MKINERSRYIQNGFTLTEFVVALGILSLTLAMIFMTKYQIDQEFRSLNVNIENKMDAVSGEKILLFDLQSANLSFNNISLKDDSGVNFFDYNPDLTVNSNPAKPDRQLTLLPPSSATTGLIVQSELVTINEDYRSGAVLVYDPVEAYDIGTMPTDMNQASTLKYISINKNNYIKNQRPQFWVENNILMFDTTSKLRPSLNLNIAPRSSMFIGQIKNDYYQKITTLNKYLNMTLPDTADVITDADMFLRTVSSVGGGVPTIRLRAVNFYRYYLDYDQNKIVKFWRSKFDASTGQWGTAFLVSDKVQKVILQRGSVSSKIVTFQIIH